MTHARNPLQYFLPVIHGRCKVLHSNAEWSVTHPRLPRIPSCTSCLSLSALHCNLHVATMPPRTTVPVLVEMLQDKMNISVYVPFLYVHGANYIFFRSTSHKISASHECPSIPTAFSIYFLLCYEISGEWVLGAINSNEFAPLATLHLNSL